MARRRARSSGRVVGQFESIAPRQAQRERKINAAAGSSKPFGPSLSKPCSKMTHHHRKILVHLTENGSLAWPEMSILPTYATALSSSQVVAGSVHPAAQVRVHRPRNHSAVLVCRQSDRQPHRERVLDSDPARREVFHPRRATLRGSRDRSRAGSTPARSRWAVPSPRTCATVRSRLHGAFSSSRSRWTNVRWRGSEGRPCSPASPG